MKPRRRKGGTDLDFFADFSMTKTGLANELGVARSTCCVWENLLFWRVTAFREAYPKRKDGTTFREAPLSPYQCWCVARCGRLMSHLTRTELVKEAISQNPAYFSKYAYNNAVKQLSKGA
ncbi:hypothetical protein VB713_12440 [Anabaena cylindrica UHCC 0172]|uniref:hypothetical protein n=1 Tax=Anabaena cylindrica TaxID=1165 RepID=UPI002B20C650|nr:hypothetical protein [Anabaena cylindrica]MEA5551781.1 hypothetical protein [Anabaena cylindrica UHCC 0172]